MLLDLLYWDKWTHVGFGLSHLSLIIGFLAASEAQRCAINPPLLLQNIWLRIQPMLPPWRERIFLHEYWLDESWFELVTTPVGWGVLFFSCSLTDADELNDPHFWYHSPGCGDSCYLPNRPLFWPRGGGSVKQQRLILVACMYTEHKDSKMFQNTLNEHPFRLSPVLL